MLVRSDRAGRCTVGESDGWDAEQWAENEAGTLLMTSICLFGRFLNPERRESRGHGQAHASAARPRGGIASDQEIGRAPHSDETSRLLLCQQAGQVAGRQAPVCLCTLKNG